MEYSDICIGGRKRGALGVLQKCILLSSIAIVM